MNVRVQFFSRLRDVTGASSAELELRDGATVAELVEKLYLQTPALREWDSSILVGAGVEFVDRTHVITAGEEIAIMPPVQGG
ncbi:MAG: MoaD/ThiS family protein [Chthoniobacterales bacterium]